MPRLDCTPWSQEDWPGVRRRAAVSEESHPSIALVVELMIVRMSSLGLGSDGGSCCRKKAGGSGVDRLAPSS